MNVSAETAEKEISRDQPRAAFEIVNEEDEGTYMYFTVYKSIYDVNKSNFQQRLGSRMMYLLNCSKELLFYY